MKYSNSLTFKITGPLIGLVIVVTAVVGLLVGRFIESLIKAKAEEQVRAKLDNIGSGLDISNQILLDKVQGTIKVLMREGQLVGPARLGDTVTVGAEQVPQLLFGDKPQASNFEIVDQIKSMVGGVSTLFVRRGNDFVRVSTNVMKDDGARALGTLLDPQGKAIVEIRQGKSFYGVVDILGKPYFTGYEPMQDEQQNVIGVWYAGYPISSLASIGQLIEEARILDSGLVALFDNKGKLAFKSKNAPPELTQQLYQANSVAGWKVERQTFTPWGYTIIAGFPENDSAIADAIAKARWSVIGVSALLVLLLAACLYFVISRSVIKPVHKLVDAFSHISEQQLPKLTQTAQAIAAGKLDCESDVQFEHLEVTTADEVGKLTVAFNEMAASLTEMGTSFEQMTEHLRASIGQISQGSSQVAAASEQISSASTQSGTYSQTLASSAEQITATMHEMAASIRQVSSIAQTQSTATTQTAAAVSEMVASLQGIAANTTQLASLTDAASKAAQRGQDTLTEAQQSLQRISQSVDSASQTINELDARAENIGKIVETIDGIADQTNRLALNAAIEAARAGEHGLGFAVVADEVRKLAERAASSTKEISDLILSTQREARAAVAQMHESNQTVREHIANTAVKEALASIISSVGQIDSFTHEIKAATNEQSVGAEQIARATQDLARLTQEVSTATEEQSVGANEVVRAMEQLRGIVRQATEMAADLQGSAGQLFHQSDVLNSVVGTFDVGIVARTNGFYSMPEDPIHHHTQVM